MARSKTGDVSFAHYPPSYYAAHHPASADAPPLVGDQHAEVCVIGGGYLGLSTALHLARAKRDVVLIERARLGWGASGRNGGQLHVGMRREQGWLEKHVGRDDADRLWRIALDARDHLDWAMHSYGIDCDLRLGHLHLDHKPSYVAHSRETVALMRTRYGYDHIEFVDKDRARALVASSDYHGGTLDRRSGHLDPLKWALGLARAAALEGARLHENSAATSIRRINGRFVVETAQGRITADQVVVGCNGYLDGLVPQIDARVMPINNFIAVTAPLGAEGAQAIIRDNLAVSDSRFIVYYFRMTPDHRLLFGGGENYSYRFPSDIAGFVRPHIARVFPQLADVGIDYAWGGALAITPNRMPCIRWVEPGLLNLSGFSGLGVLLAPWFGKLAADGLTEGNDDLDLMTRLPSQRFPGGKLLRWPTMVAAMTFFGLVDRL